MALSGRLARRSPHLLRQCRSIARSEAVRNFTSCAASPLAFYRQHDAPKYHSRSIRKFSSAAVKRNLTEEAPNAQAYLNSGAIAGARDLVDVKKVLVIGSGGLAIGQAGEFDYSGKQHLNWSLTLQYIYRE